MQPINVTAVFNKNGVLTILVLMEDGTIFKKAEDEDSWKQIGSVPRHRNDIPVKQDPPVRNKGTKKRGS